MMTGLVARFRARLRSAWDGPAGKRFRGGLQGLEEFARENRIMPEDVVEDGLNLGRRKLQGLASKEYASAEKNLGEAAKAAAEAQLNRIQGARTELTMGADVLKASAEAIKARADADLALTKAIEARFELERKLAAHGLALRVTEACDYQIVLREEAASSQARAAALPNAPQGVVG